MKILAIMGSYRKGKTIDTLLDKAIEGAKAGNPQVEIEKVSHKAYHLGQKLTG